ncbi:hypothetical protein KC966_18330, partial [Proteus terrae]|uniref:hypothetical protein n=1 Tax=Proteus terrae TaxID=1574161 RepID=UPI003315ED18
HLNKNTILRDTFADIIVLLATSSLKTVKKAAEPILNTLPAEIEENKTSKHSYNWAQRHYKDLSKIDEKQCRALVDKLNSGQG